MEYLSVELYALLYSNRDAHVILQYKHQKLASEASFIEVTWLDLVRNRAASRVDCHRKNRTLA